ncbi:DNA-directed RNA polymerase, mitochondrial [Schizosaccharomyces pombe]|uniref:DNA-directed RNA polymerase, mitochondrial n=1 Tax=Schizosaccharomyces pombe (strain 972 / ATCC 24843) TaxID=284812 RepID=RPOM_SCHPO|nr:RNA polymerase Rpo41 [Schizosaccharomyces pombe]O13993.2 RecName: Full=DNA-directed RNA polymerase, mitochondrial; Flags: Precursor [Schizosaccharomyces pombe 972h-]CAB16197.2 mitochondrial RNA polymerase Rpo41 [Schizosaccharomyces pombe]|eukprot:NP_594459.2 RNA polymerase Rpo41 [Schizosaccharomyces pombe]
MLRRKIQTYLSRSHIRRGLCGLRFFQTQRLHTDYMPIEAYEPYKNELKSKIGKDFIIDLSYKSGTASLFEACVYNGDFLRSKQLLKSFIDHNKGDKILLPMINLYIREIIQRGSFELTDVLSNAKELLQQARLNGDSLTYALLCQASLNPTQRQLGLPVLHELIHNWRSANGKVIDILMHESVFSPEEVKLIMDQLNIPINNFTPSQLQLLGITNSTIVGESENGKDQNGDSSLKEKQPDVETTVTKSANLNALRSSLSSLLTESIDLPIDEVSLEFGNQGDTFNLARQKLLEKSAILSAAEVWKSEHESVLNRGNLQVPKNVSSLFYSWYVQLEQLFKEEISLIDDLALNESLDKKNDRLIYGPFLKLLSSKKLAALTIMEVAQLSTNPRYDRGARVTTLLGGLGRSFEREFLSEQIQRQEKNKSYKDKKRLKELFNDPRKFRQAVKNLRLSNTRDNIVLNPSVDSWPSAIVMKVGSVALCLLLSVAKIEVTAKDLSTGGILKQEVAAFVHTYQYSNGRKVGMIVPHVEFYKLLSRDIEKPHLHPQLLPMLVTPKPWTSWIDGGYYYSRQPLVRLKGALEQVDYLMKASENGQLDELFKAVSSLGKVSWRINQRLFNVLIRIWNSGEKFLSIPPREVKCDMPPYPKNSINPRDKVIWHTRRKELAALKTGAHSQRCDFNYKLEIARAFLNEKFYFPHSLDFRGRAYPLSSHLHHVSNDVCRGLLEFSTGKPLGPKGLNWLKVHLANLFGISKKDFATRQAFVDDNMQEVFDSADRPLDGNKWWSKADDPFQALAACFEIAEAVRSGDHESYISHIPIQQDGTCNGLQHYAALGGDIEGAKQVNLWPSDHPSDVYEAVAEIVRGFLKKDAEAGDEMANFLKDKVTRSVVKPTVMTNVYGVTYVGARKQISEKLENIDGMEKLKVADYANYLTKKVFEALRSLFTQAHEIQDWLSACCNLITHSLPADYIKEGIKDELTPVVWTTLLNLPIVQPYRNYKSRQIRTNLQTVFIEERDRTATVQPHKQATAFPPNFIHSLDATHMFMTCLKCSEQNINFAAVHDSYWTHACDVDQMNSLLREAFVLLHSNNIMERLKQEFEERYKGFLVSKKAIKANDEDLKAKFGNKSYIPLEFPPLPARGALDLKKVLESKYFFS